MKKSKIGVTCLSIDCPERKSLCCGAISEASIADEGTGCFVCSKCKKEYIGGECNALQRISAYTSCEFCQYEPKNGHAFTCPHYKSGGVPKGEETCFMTDHNPVWAGDGYFCSVCMLRFIPKLESEGVKECCDVCGNIGIDGRPFHCDKRYDCPCHKNEPPVSWEEKIGVDKELYFDGVTYKGSRHWKDIQKKSIIVKFIREVEAQAISSFKKEIVEKVGEMRKEPTLCAGCNMNGALCTRCYGNRQVNSALEEVIKLLNEPQ